MSENKIIIDSCVFFFMLEASDVYVKNGKVALREYCDKKGELIRRIEKRTMDIAGSGYGFVSKNLKDTLENLKDFFSDYKSIEQKIERIKTTLSGVVCDKNGFKNLELSPEKTDVLNNKLKKLTKQCEIKKAFYEEFNIYHEKYLNAYQPYYASELFYMCVNGDVELCIVQDSLAEIKYHSETINQSNENFKTFDEDKIYTLLKFCTIITVAPSNIKYINELACEYRTRIDDSTSPMKNDINSLGIYGDSRIMAEASLVGVKLVTFNEKDFIRDKSVKSYNSRIRNHIGRINAIHGNNETSVLPYSVMEVIELIKVCSSSKENTFSNPESYLTK